MARKQKTIHYLYKTICLVTGRYYIGMHSTCNLEDGYMGSGKRLRRSIRKYCIDNHKKEILEFFDTRELLIEAEKGAITPEMVMDNNCMNLMGGGEGGFISEEQQRHRSKCANKKLNEKLKDDVNFRNYWLTKLKLGVKKSYEGSRKRDNGVDGFKNKKHSEETKLKIGKINSIRQLGEKNSQYGTCWVTKERINKKIKTEELNQWVKEGWIKGRIIKK